MLLKLLFLVLLLFLLYFLSRKISSSIYFLILSISNNHRLSVGILAFILLPGTFIHEFSHLITATLLGVRTGKLHLLPTIEKNKGIKGGSLEIVKPDPFRHTLIGLAPILIGLFLLYLIGSIFVDKFQLFQFSADNLLFLIAITYLLFTISITMFSSKKDLESFVFVAPILVIFALTLHYTGIKIVFEEKVLTRIEEILKSINLSLMIASVFNYLIYISLQFILKLKIKSS